MKGKLIGGFLAGLVAFVTGWYPEHTKRTAAEEASTAMEQKLRASEQALAMSTFRNRAALIHDIAGTNDYATAGTEAGKLFTDMRTFTNALAAGGLKDGLEKILGHRDAVIAGLAKADPAVKEELRSVFLELQKI